MNNSPSSERPLVFVVDDDDAVRRSLSQLLRAGGRSVEPYPSAEAFLAALATGDRAGSIACAIVDIRMGSGMDGLALQEELARRNFGIAIAVVIVTGHADVPLAVRAMRAGAIDFIEKPYLPGQILAAVTDALEAARSNDMAKAQSALSAARLKDLTTREREVLTALVAGQTNKVIARELGISPRTVEAHRATLMDRLGVRSLAEAIRVGIAAGLG